MGAPSVEDVASIEAVLHELLVRMDSLERVHKQEVAHIRLSLDQWQEITQSLSSLLEVRTRETAEVGRGYRTLSEHLVRFGQHLASSEAILRRVDGPFMTSASSLPDLIAKVEEVGIRLEAESQSESRIVAAVMEKLNSMQARTTTRSETSIWTELAQWRAAVVWLLIGAAAMGVAQYVIFQGSGFQAALREVRAGRGAVDRRLERIEIWLGIVEEENAP